MAKGGGVLFVTGPLTRGEYVNQDLYRKGEGLFPVPLGERRPLRRDELDDTPDVHSEEHPVFQNIGRPESDLADLRAEYFAVAAGWKPKTGPSVRRDHATPQPRSAPGGEELQARAGSWPSFPRLPRARSSGTTGAWPLPSWPSCSIACPTSRTALDRAARCWWANRKPWRSAFLPSSRKSFFRSGGRCLGGHDQRGKRRSERTACSGARRRCPGRRGRTESLFGHEPANAVYAKTALAGFYKAELRQASLKTGPAIDDKGQKGPEKALPAKPAGNTEVHNFAVNVDAGEGDLRGLTGADLASRLAPVKYVFESAATYQSSVDETEGRNLGDLLLLLLLIVLFLEQLFAWSCGYHVATKMTNPWAPGGPSRAVENAPSAARKEARHDCSLALPAGSGVGDDEIRVWADPVQRRVVDLRRRPLGAACPLDLDLPPRCGRVALVSARGAAAVADLGADRPAARLSPAALAEPAGRTRRQPRADARQHEPEHEPPRSRRARKGPDAIAAGGLRPERYRVPGPPAEDAPRDRGPLQQRLGRGPPRGLAPGGPAGGRRASGRGRRHGRKAPLSLWERGRG